MRVMKKHNPLALLTDSRTGNPTAVNTMSVETVSKEHGKTVITFLSGTTLTVREPFEEAVRAFAAVQAR
jgi:uncharacterized protein YlzI (FlbEa/FlbD family)